MFDIPECDVVFVIFNLFLINYYDHLNVAAKRCFIANQKLNRGCLALN